MYNGASFGFNSNNNATEISQKLQEILPRRPVSAPDFESEEENDDEVDDSEKSAFLESNDSEFNFGICQKVLKTWF